MPSRLPRLLTQPTATLSPEEIAEQLRRWEILILGPGRLLAAIVDDFSGLEADLALNAGGTFVLTLPADAVAAEHCYLQDGDEGDRRITVTRDGVPMFAGPIRQVVRTQDERGDTLEISGTDDTARLADRVIRPNPNGPALTDPPYVVSADLGGGFGSSDGATHALDGPAETVLKKFVDAHAGPSSSATFGQADRPIPGLVIDTDAAIGATIQGRARFDNLLDWLQRFAAEGALGQVFAPDSYPMGTLVFGIEVNPADWTELVFYVRAPQDLRADIAFSRELGNLTTAVHEEVAATGNHITAGGKGETSQRNFVHVGDAASISRYGQIELFVDARSAENGTELADQASGELEANREQIGVDFTPAPDPPAEDGGRRAEYGVDYFMGDVVSPIVDGVLLAGHVSRIGILLDPSQGAVITPGITTAPVSTPPGARGRQTGQRVGYLERNAEGLTRGAVVMWVRPVGEIPAGWLICDGTNGTPDMRNRLPIGADQLTLGSTAGLTLSAGALTINLQHSHGPNTLAFPHTHAHSHGMEHDHAHAHGLVPHDHEYDLNHDHAIADTSGVIVETVIIGTASLGSGTSDHHHTVDLPALGSTPLSTSVGSVVSDDSAFSTTQSDDQPSSASSTESDSAAISSTGTATGTTTSSLSATQSILPPVLAIHFIYKAV